MFCHLQSFKVRRVNPTVPLRDVSCRACCDHGRRIFFVDTRLTQGAWAWSFVWAFQVVLFLSCVCVGGQFLREGRGPSCGRLRWCCPCRVFVWVVCFYVRGVVLRVVVCGVVLVVCLCVWPVSKWRGWSFVWSFVVLFLSYVCVCGLFLSERGGPWWSFVWSFVVLFLSCVCVCGLCLSEGGVMLFLWQKLSYIYHTSSYLWCKIEFI